MGTQLPPPERGTAAPTQFSAHVYCGQTTGWIKMKLGMEVGLGRRPWPHCVRWRHGSPPPKGHSPQCSAHVCCGQTAGWIKMPLGREIGLGPGDIVLDGDPAPSLKGHSLPNFLSMSIVAKQLPIAANAQHLLWLYIPTSGRKNNGNTSAAKGCFACLYGIPLCFVYYIEWC